MFKKKCVCYTESVDINTLNYDIFLVRVYASKTTHTHTAQ